MSDSRVDEQRTLVICAVWLHTGFIGAAAVAAALLGVVAVELNPLSALSLAMVGAIVATVCWRRAGHVVDQPSADESTRNVARGRNAIGTTGVRRSTAIQPETSP